jgi:hypothetical protein
MAASSPPPPEPRSEAGDRNEERYGPLRIRRLVKDDGRSLILYRRAGGGDREDR